MTPLEKASLKKLPNSYRDKVYSFEHHEAERKLLVAKTKAAQIEHISRSEISLWCYYVDVTYSSGNLLATNNDEPDLECIEGEIRCPNTMWINSSGGCGLVSEKLRLFPTTSPYLARASAFSPKSFETEEDFRDYEHHITVTEHTTCNRDYSFVRLHGTTGINVPSKTFANLRNAILAGSQNTEVKLGISFDGFDYKGMRLLPLPSFQRLMLRVLHINSFVPYHATKRTKLSPDYHWTLG